MPGLTSNQITTRAMEIVNNMTLATVSQNFLNSILHKIYTDYTWDFLSTTATLSFSASIGSAALPTDYQKHIAMKWVDGSVTPNQEHMLEWMDFEDYVAVADPTRAASRPEYYTIGPERSLSSSGAAGQFLIYPRFQAAGSTKLYYYYLPADLTTGATPLFTNHHFLIEATANELMRYMRDSRYDPIYIEKRIRSVRANITEMGSHQPRILPLDRRFFNRGG